MATQSTARSSSATARTRARSTRRGDETAPISGRVKALGRGVFRAIPDFSIPNRLAREGIAIFLAIFAILSGWVIWGGNSDGTLVTQWDSALRWFGGRGAFVAPIILILAAYRIGFAGEEPVFRPWHIVGGALFLFSTVGLIALAGKSADGADGGWVGQLVAPQVRGLVGSLGGGLVLFATGVFAIFLMTGTDIRSFVAEIKELIPKGRGDQFDLTPFREEVRVAVAPRPKPVEPKAVPVKPAPEPPVINRPKAFQPAQTTETDAATKASTVVAGKPMRLPEIGNLALYDSVALDETELQTKADIIELTLGNFKVDARVREINPGPAVTQFTLEPGVGVKVRKITELQNDLALSLAAPSIRIEAPVPGQARVGIEIPNAKIATVGLRETLESTTFAEGGFKLPIPLGRDVNGNHVIHDLTKMPHLLIAGATGSGKSVCLTTIISTFLLTRGPDQLKMVMIDPKMVELTGYNGVPHLQCPVITEMDKVVGALRLVLQEMERRYTLFSKLGVRNLDGYRLKMADESNAEVIPYLVVIIDELADLMMTAPVDVETVLCRLAQMGRASGIHLIIATQRPSVDVLTGLIKANVPARIAFAVTSLTDSRVVLDLPGAERLLGRGDMLFLPPDAPKPQRIQGAFVEDRDVQNIVHHWHQVTPIPQYAPEWLNLNAPDDPGADFDAEDDPLMKQARDIIREQGTASTSMLQRRLRIGYNRAARLIEQLEDDGLIGPADGIKGRPWLGDDF